MGIEPTRPAWKAGILPLNYTRLCHPLILAAAASASMLDGENLLHLAISHPEHAVVQVNGSIVIMHQQLDRVPDLHGYVTLNFNRCVFGVQGFHPQPRLAFDEGKPRSPLMAFTPASTTSLCPGVLLTTVARTLRVISNWGAALAYQVSINR